MLYSTHPLRPVSYPFILAFLLLLPNFLPLISFEAKDEVVFDQMMSFSCVGNTHSVIFLVEKLQ